MSSHRPTTLERAYELARGGGCRTVGEIKQALQAEGFERIHRTNLVGMGVLPLEFKPGVNRKTLALDGTETYDVIGRRTPRATLTLVVNRKNGERIEVPMTCRLDTAEEISVYEAGGVLQRFAKDFLEGAVA